MGTSFLVGLALLLVQVVPLLWRRSHPSLVLLLVGAAFGARVLLGFNPGIAGFGLLVAMYSVAAYEVGARRLVFLVVAGLGFVAGFVVFGVTGNPRSFAITVPSLFFVAAWLARARGLRSPLCGRKLAGRADSRRHLTFPLPSSSPPSPACGGGSGWGSPLHHR